MEQTAVSLNFSNIVQLVLGTGFVTALFNQGIGWVRDWRKDKTVNNRMALYSAARLATQLESFCIVCARAILESDRYTGSGGRDGNEEFKIPELGDFPNDIEWKSIEPKLCAKVLTLRNIITLSHGEIHDGVYYLSPGDEMEGHQVYCEQTGLRGFLAWQVAIDLRDHYGLPSFDPKQVSWDVEKIIKEYHDKAKENLSKRSIDQI